MQLHALRTTTSTYYFSQAYQQLHNISQELLIEPEAQWNETITHWNQQMSQSLPNGSGLITAHCPQLSLKLSWGNRANLNCNKNTVGESGCAILEVNC